MSEDTQDVNDILMGGGGAPAASFGTIGVVHGGRILAMKPKQEREFDRDNPGNGALKFFKSGDPIMGVVVTVQTEARDPNIPDDDGKRRLFLEGQRLKEAVRNAVQEAGAKLEIGGVLEVAYVGDGTPPSVGANAPKLYQARYTPAPAAAANAALQQGQTVNPFGPNTTPPVAGFPTAVPGKVAAPAQPAAPVDEPPGDFDPALWATLNDVQKAALRQVQQQQTA